MKLSQAMCLGSKQSCNWILHHPQRRLSLKKHLSEGTSSTELKTRDSTGFQSSIPLRVFEANLDAQSEIPGRQHALTADPSFHSDAHLRLSEHLVASEVQLKSKSNDGFLSGNIEIDGFEFSGAESNFVPENVKKEQSAKLPIGLENLHRRKRLRWRTCWPVQSFL